MALSVLLFHSGLMSLQNDTARNFRWRQMSVSFGVCRGVGLDVRDGGVMAVVFKGIAGSIAADSAVGRGGRIAAWQDADARTSAIGMKCILVWQVEVGYLVRLKLITEKKVLKVRKCGQVLVHLPAMK